MASLKEGGLCSTPLQKYMNRLKPMIELLYRGFDGLDVSFKGQISLEFAVALDQAKTTAQNFRSQVGLDWNGVHLNVFESGARGGYAYMATTGDFGATWFFKKPNAYDPWGVRVSCNSFFLAINGLGIAKTKLYETIEALGVRLAPDAASIGRVDYALDFLAPDLVLEPEHFVMHSNARRADHIEPDPITANGRSGRVTSVTIGKMPGRQVIVYDKRAEIISKSKVGWWEIWNATRAKHGLPALVRHAPNAGQVWRVEIRGGKKHLKDRWRISTWSDLHTRFGDMVIQALDAVRHTSPSEDGNRSRWPNSALWAEVLRNCDDDLFEMCNYAPPELIKQVQRDKHDELLARQMMGLLTTRAAIRGVEPSELADFALAEGYAMAKKIMVYPDRFDRKLSHAASRYDVQS